MVDDILEKHRSVAKPNGLELLFKHQDALRLLDDFERNDVIVTGMSFYKDQDGYVAEMIGNDADYSDLVDEDEPAAKTVREAKELLSDGLPDGADWVSFTCRNSPRQ